jgi:hypothetical protein
LIAGEGKAEAGNPLRDPSARREISTEEDVGVVGDMMGIVRSGLKAVEMMGSQVRMWTTDRYGCSRCKTYAES